MDHTQSPRRRRIATLLSGALLAAGLSVGAGAGVEAGKPRPYNGTTVVVTEGGTTEPVVSLAKSGIRW